MSLAAQVLTALLLGIFAGLFFGEPMAPVGVLGAAFVLLLQMTVLPFMMVSLIRSLGSLKLSDAKMLALRASSLLVVIWLIVIACVVLMTFGLPDWPSASFFSNDLVSEKEAFDFLTLFIPANPFASLTETVVPAVVVFSIAFGVALIGLDPKAALLDAWIDLKQKDQTIERLFDFWVRGRKLDTEKQPRWSIIRDVLGWIE